MALSFARDSYGDLSEIQRRLQAEKEQHRQQRNNGDGSNHKNNNNLGMISLLWKKSSKQHSHDDSFYELCHESFLDENDDEWPMWEMTGGNDSWAGNRTSEKKSGEGKGGSPYHYPIHECERIFTVPEIYNELQLELQQENIQPQYLSLRLEPQKCNWLGCLTPWKLQGNAGPAFAHHHASLPGSDYDNEDGIIKGNISDRDDNERRNVRGEKKNNHPGGRQQKRPKGIIRRTSMAVQVYLGMPAAKRQSFTPSMYKIQLDDSDDEGEGGGNHKRRVSIIGNDRNRIFTVGSNDEEKEEYNFDSSGSCHHNCNSKKNRRVHFSELKRVLKIRKFTSDEALDVWFQREDFDHFKAEMTLLIQETEANKELAEDWLLDPEEVQRRRSHASLQDLSENALNGDSIRGTVNRSSTTSSVRSETNRTKSRAWWHDYDHSRRGLERYASPGQARQILASYKVAVQKVLEEQRRQRLVGWFCCPQAKDPDRIAELYHEYTSWSRDLALAAAASDADAVKMNFDDDKRKTREYYLLKQVIQSGYKVHKHMPQFMLPRCITPKGFLDESESLYLNDHTYLGGMMKLASSKLRIQTGGAKAREEMSKLQAKDLEGPLAPALAPIIRADSQEGKVDEHGNKIVGSSPSMGEAKLKSMASKAKNFPFQQ